MLDALGLRERSIGRQARPRGPVGRLCDALADREAVLILDNCEHVIDAAAALADGCSRLPPRPHPRDQPRAAPHPGRDPLAGPPLPVPPRPTSATPADASAYPAIRLFGTGPSAVLPASRLTRQRRRWRICGTLDGMPLAIELAPPGCAR